jgi:NADPH-dependent ferric siderophore reductase
MAIVIVGDTASLPAINSLLTAIGDIPARVILEAGHDDDKQLAVARSADVVWVDRKKSDEALVQAVSAQAYWVA